MYTLYFLPGACSLATQVVLRELNLPFELKNKNQVDHFRELNPLGTVPVLSAKEEVLTEGAAILIYLLEKHAGSMLPQAQPQRRQVIENLMFANATVHPAYGTLFFIKNTLAEGEAQTAAFRAAATRLEAIWQVVEDKLSVQYFLGGDEVSPVDILLTVYAGWGDYFPVDINIGPKSRAMIARVKQLPSYVASVSAERDAS